MIDSIKKNIAILGSTGSIGTQALDIIRKNRDKFNACVLTANKNWELLVEQALEFEPECVVIADESLHSKVKEALSHSGIKILSGTEAISDVAAWDKVDMVLTAMVGYSGLLPTISAIKARKTIALANKETLVVAGEIITKLTKEYDVRILPVDSEHSAIFQCLEGEEKKAVSKILLTASGGPFRKLSEAELEKVTVAQALNHPNWNMGAKVTIDSASMMNKGFEMIEARWLFDCLPDNIQVLVHPQSIVHSMVQFCDGSIKAQLGIPDMRIPIQYALSYPHRLNSPEYYLEWAKVHELTFEEPDLKKFPLLGIAFEAIRKGGNLPCIMNAANEIAVKDFLEGKISFTQMPHLVQEVMDTVEYISSPTIQDLIETNKIARQKASEWIKTH